MLSLTPKGISVKSYRPTKRLINSYATVITSTLTSPNSHISIPKMPSLRKLHLLALPFLLLLLPLPFLRPSLPLTPHRHFLSLSVAANFSIAAHLRTLTRRPHLAGTPAAAAPAAYVLSHFRRSGLQAHTREYSPLLSYPAAASLSLHHANLSLIKPLSLAEPADPAAVSVAPYHAYSPSGSALAPAVFVNYGTTKDYLTLRRLGIDLRGCIAVARGGVGYRGAVVERAAENGASAVLIFGDAAGGVERGKVTLRGVGDPLTPGWAAAAAAGGSERLQVEDDEVKGVFQKIPSMPVAAATAAEILGTLGGPAVPAEWQDGLLMPFGGVGGRGGEATLVNFTYQDDRRMGTIQDVFGVIKGCEEPDRYVILGNHRDAWTYGAVDPNSGTAALLDVAHRFGVLLKSGWKPRRTIILCSWDAEEFGMIGSTEWVEQNVGILGSNAVAYINVDCAVQGPGFFAGATPQLDKLLLEITKQIKDPDAEGMSVYQTWIARNGGTRIERLARADSDFSAFLHHVGVPSIDLYFGEAFPGYHTSFDSYKWMVEHGDPLFHRHVAMAEIWGLLALRLANDPVLPFDFLSYAVQLQEHTNALRDLLDGDELLQPVNASIHKLMDAANVAQGEAKKLQEQQNSEDFRELTQRAFNDRMILTERGFLEAEGLRGRPWFKHLLYAPPADYESKLSFFPGIADAISLTAKVAGKERQSEIRHEIWRVARAIGRAADVLRGELT